MVVVEAGMSAAGFWQALLMAFAVLSAENPGAYAGNPPVEHGVNAGHPAALQWGGAVVSPEAYDVGVGSGSVYARRVDAVAVAHDGDVFSGSVRRIDEFSSHDALSGAAGAAGAAGALSVPAGAVDYHAKLTNATDIEYLSSAYGDGSKQMPLAEVWGRTLTSKMQALSEVGPDVDDHDGTPIGAGDTIGMVGAEVTMDSAALRALRPELQSGLLAACDGPCASWPTALRVSHTNAGVDLLRIALSMKTGSGVVDFHFTETVKTFPMADAASLEAFIYMNEHGPLWAALKYPKQILKIGANVAWMKHKYEKTIEEHGAHGAIGKDYYSLTPFQVGTSADGGAASAMKLRLRPQNPDRAAPTFGDNDARKQYREQFVKDVQADNSAFDLMIQVAADPKLHPINDATVEWDEKTAPWVKVGEVKIPKQAFPRFYSAGGHTAASAIGSAFGDTVTTKDFLFAPGNNPHLPVGDISAFRMQYYPIYDKARREHLLGKTDDPPKCPFAQIAKLFGR